MNAPSPPVIEGQAEDVSAKVQAEEAFAVALSNLLCAEDHQSLTTSTKVLLTARVLGNLLHLTTNLADRPAAAALIVEHLLQFLYRPSGPNPFTPNPTTHAP